MSVFVIFRRESVPGDPRVRWHEVDRITLPRSASRPSALRKFGIPYAKGYDCIAVGMTQRPEVDGIPNGVYMAERLDRVDFEHYNAAGRFVPA